MSFSNFGPQQHFPVTWYAAVGRSPQNGLGTAGMILGIVAATTFWMPVLGVAAPVCSTLAIVFGAIGLSRARRGTATNRGRAKAGLVLGVGYWVVMVVLFAAITIAR